MMQEPNYETRKSKKEKKLKRRYNVYRRGGGRRAVKR